MKMILAVMAIGAACVAAPASAQSIAGCGTATPTKAEAASIPKLTVKADCFAKAGAAAGKAEKTHRDAIVAATPKPTPEVTPQPTEPKYWIDCAIENQSCRVPAASRVRYGAAGKFAYRDTSTSILCGNGTFGDPIPGTAKACAYGSDTPAPVVTPAPAPPAPPAPAPVAPITGKPVAARDRLGINVSGISYYGGEPIFANQLFGLRWLLPQSGWSGAPASLFRPDGFPKAVNDTPAAPIVVSILNPPMEAKTTDTAVTRCTWQGSGKVSLGGERRDLKWADHLVEFQWPKKVMNNTVWVSIERSDAADPIRAMDCRLTTEAADAYFAPQLLQFLKPFGVLRFLDMSSANGNPGSLTWGNRTQPGDLGQYGDGIALEIMLKLANANNSSPWLTIPWNADADYHRRAAQLAHDTLPAGKPVYVEVSNEVWNYSFGQAGQAEREGLAAKLSDNGFQANIRRLAQKTIEVMPIWEAVFKDRPSDLVRVVATQADNAWVGGNLFEYNNGEIAKHIDAIAIAPYFKVDTDKLVADHDTNMTALAAEAKRQVLDKSAQYKTLTDKWGVRLIAYEGGQHQMDPDNQARLEAMNRDPRMEGIYRQYLTDWQALTGDEFTLYAATGPYSKYGAWGLREYAGQPLSETPKLRGVLDFAKKN